MLLATNSLKDEAVRLEKRNGSARVLDGPFTESKEMIGGFFLLGLRHAGRGAGSGPAVPGRRVGHDRGA